MISRHTQVPSFDFDYRLEIMRDVQLNLSDLNEDFLEYLEVNKWDLFFSRHVFKYRAARKMLRAFNKESQEIHDASLVKYSDNDPKIDLLCAFNELLEHYKPHFILMVNVTQHFPEESAEDMFNILTYGGKL